MDILTTHSPAPYVAPAVFPVLSTLWCDLSRSNFAEFMEHLLAQGPGGPEREPYDPKPAVLRLAEYRTEVAINNQFYLQEIILGGVKPRAVTLSSEDTRRCACLAERGLIVHLDDESIVADLFGWDDSYDI